MMVQASTSYGSARCLPPSAIHISPVILPTFAASGLRRQAL